MLTIRSLHWPADRALLLALDTAFETNQIYQIVQHAHSFALVPVAVTPALRKDYQFARDVERLPDFERVLVAEEDSAIIGVAAVKLESWNRRAVLEHFYIAPSHRGRGVGQRLMESVLQAIPADNVRCLWLETQNINYGAIQFYQRMGFHWCGLDTSLYDPKTTDPAEIALFFVRYLA
ncbi:MAG TPA: GNAT family N-acetyltransferase [Herpetosiphonaceae bacterium]